MSAVAKKTSMQCHHEEEGFQHFSRSNLYYGWSCQQSKLRTRCRKAILHLGRHLVQKHNTCESALFAHILKMKIPLGSILQIYLLCIAVPEANSGVQIGCQQPFTILEKRTAWMAPFSTHQHFGCKDLCHYHLVLQMREMKLA